MSAMSMMLSLQIFTAVISFTVASMIAWINFVRPWLRNRKLKKPFEIRFKDGSNRDSPETDELSVAANSEVKINFRIRPNVHHVVHELILNIQGPSDEKPLVRSFINTFVREGKATASPETDDSHYIDYNHNYHMMRHREYTKGNSYAVGYVIKTRNPGQYPVLFKAMTEGGDSESKNQLTLIVE
ncbi:MAG: hypothetical protein GY807_16280 [Gammaproteobacteria bacterium]|nr:hypothetical protein [Gammaproteobacteria bacterium]